MSAKPTAAPWELRDGAVWGLHIIAYKDGDEFQIAGQIGGEIYKDSDGAYTDRREVVANAALIAEAGTVLHETGCSPRELVEALEYCYRASGADPTHMPTRIGEAAKSAVDELRRDYTEACEEVAQLAAQRAELVAALDTANKILLNSMAAGQISERYSTHTDDFSAVLAKVRGGAK